MEGLTTGRIVHYILTGADADQINRRRTNSKSIHDRITENNWPLGAQAHIGNYARDNDHRPAMIVETFDESAGTSNLQVFLDGNDVFWATSRMFGDAPGTWHWIEKA